MIGRQVFAWGLAADGQLGMGGGADNCATPMPLPRINSPISAVFAGADHSFITLSKQRVTYKSFFDGREKFYKEHKRGKFRFFKFFLPSYFCLQDGYVAVTGPTIRSPPITHLTLDRLKCCDLETTKKFVISYLYNYHASCLF